MNRTPGHATMRQDPSWCDPRAVTFIETVAPTVRPETDAAWHRAVARNPRLFDGPVAMCLDARFTSTGGPTMIWARGTYRHRFATGTRPAAIFAAVIQPLPDGRVAVGRSASWTSRPARIQLPGGVMEPPADGALTLHHLRTRAAIELDEELGVDTDPRTLVPLCAGRMPNGNVGFFFVAEARDESSIRERFAARCASDLAAGNSPEFDELLFIDSAANVHHAADHLAPALRLSRRRGAGSRPPRRR